MMCVCVCVCVVGLVERISVCVCELMLLRVGFSGLAHISVCVCVSKRVFVCVYV